TGTENVLLAATLARGATVIENAALEPEIEDLAALLVSMGASIRGAGTARIEVEGVELLRGTPRPHAVRPDRIETGTYLAAAVISGGAVTVDNVRPRDLEAFLGKLAAAGARVEIGDDWIRVERTGPLRAVDVETAPHPGYPTDLQAQLMAVLTQAEG